MTRKLRLLFVSIFTGLFFNSMTAFAGLFATNELNTAPNNATMLTSSFVASDRQIGFRATDFTYLQIEPSKDLEFLEGVEPYRSLRFDFTQSLDDQLLHLSSTAGEEEQQFRLGTSIGETTYSVHMGRGHSFAKSEHAYQGLNPYFFHGGVDLDYQFTGADLKRSLTDTLDAQIGAVRLTNPDVDDRFGYFTGLSSSRFYSRFALYERGDDKVGQGLDTGLVFGRLQVEYQELKTTNDASLRRLSLLVNGDDHRKIRLDLESGRNPLYEDGDENRIMLSFSGLIGKTNTSFHASETEPTEEEAKKKRHKGFMIGGIAVGGVVAASALSSSGDKDNDDAQRFATQNAAARNVLNRINPTSVRQNREHGGWVYRRSDNTFSSTEPVQGQVASVFLPDPTPGAGAIPSGTRATASYHTHGGPDPRFVNEEFSPQDLQSDRLFGVDGYLGTPAGRFLFHNHRTGAVVQLGTIAN